MQSSDEPPNKRVKRRATIRDVAREAGVSLGTVSLALSDNPSVAKTTKAHVREVGSRLGYQSSALGQALRHGRTNAIGVVVPHSGHHVFSHLYFMELLEGISEVLNAEAKTLVLSTSSKESEEAMAYAKIVRSQIVDGLILASAALHDKHIAQLQLTPYPFVFIGRYPPDLSVYAVGIDDVGGARAATQHLLDHGHTRIAHIGGPEGHLSTIDRCQGYEEALRGAGQDARPEHFIFGDYSEESGRLGMKALLALPHPPTAIFAGNDETAVGAMAVLRAAGIEPGAEFPVVGFDDVRLARVVTPPLTTIRQPMKSLGSSAAELLLRLIRGERPEQFQWGLPTQLIIRRSCGCTTTEEEV